MWESSIYAVFAAGCRMSTDRGKRCAQGCWCFSHDQLTYLVSGHVNLVRRMTSPLQSGRDVANTEWNLYSWERDVWRCITFTENTIFGAFLNVSSQVITQRSHAAGLNAPFLLATHVSMCLSLCQFQTDQTKLRPSEEKPSVGADSSVALHRCKSQTKLRLQNRWSEHCIGSNFTY